MSVFYRAEDEKEEGVLLRSTTPIKWGTRERPNFIEVGNIPDGVKYDVASLLAVVYPQREWSPEIVRQIFTNDMRVKRLWVLYDEADRPIGVAAAQIKPEHEPGVNVHWISVRPDRQQEGFGEFLLSLLWAWVQENNKDAIFAHCTTYTPGVAMFYRQLGFVEV